ncbi:hypothetical protein ACFW5I_37245 [Streptomyces sp. NPDC058818]|uniref:hypothetical protein n=1 Tax=Streptomyces sp. NPDC058818 TaxID=3346640 RepID=UPI0036932F45
MAHLQAMTGAYDVLYGFGAVDFTNPRELPPSAAAALKPGGRLVFATLAHYLNGAPAQPDAVAAEIPAKTPDGETTAVRRWVLREHVWTKLLDEAGLTDITVDVLPAASRRAAHRRHPAGELIPPVLGSVVKCHAHIRSDARVTAAS